MYILEGNIGAGKSTLLKLIAERTQLGVCYEPLDQWQQQIDGQSLLANFYQDPKRWAFSMETFTMLTRVKAHIRESEHANPSRIVERSLYSGNLCFARNSYQNGFMSDLEWAMYSSWFTFLTATTCRPPQGFIYLQLSPAIAHERIKQRARSSEENIPLEYLEQLHTCHEKFLIHKESLSAELKDVPVLVIPVDKDFEFDADHFSLIARSIEHFIATTATHHKAPRDQQTCAL